MNLGNHSVIVLNLEPACRVKVPKILCGATLTVSPVHVNPIPPSFGSGISLLECAQVHTECYDKFDWKGLYPYFCPRRDRTRFHSYVTFTRILTCVFFIRVGMRGT